MEQQSLLLGQQYDRRQVHGIFSPETEFTPKAGTWGLHGIVAIPDRPNDFVFFVTYGQSQGDHDFDEGITADGVLSWQSQPRHRLDSSIITTLVGHNELTNTVYLFLRESKRIPYTYLGRLGYLSHDVTREQPVFFQWQLLDWDEISPEARPTLIDVSPGSVKAKAQINALEIDGAPPVSGSRKSVDTSSFRARKVPDYAERDARNRALGLAGEKLVFEKERERLTVIGRPDLADSVVHTSVVEGDGAGYDIRSYDDNGSLLYLEVKTTRGNASTDFFMSSNEVAFAKAHAHNYRLFRVYDWDDQSKSGRAFLLSGSELFDRTEAIPTSYKMKLR